MRGFASLVLIAALAGCAPANLDQPEQWRAVNVTATQVDFGAETVGRLRFRGGLELHSPDTVFGGLSGLEVLEDGRLFAISDNGDWFEGQIQLDEGGALIGLSGVRTAFMRDERGELFPTKEEGDSEGLAQLPDGRFAVSFEQSQTIRLYDMNRDGPFGAATPGPSLAGTERLPDNAGLEALAATAEGELVVGAEGGEEGATPIWVVPLNASAPVPPRIGFPLREGFSLTSLDRLPDGGFVALQRFYAPVIGARARISIFPAASLNARAEILPDVQELATISPPLAVDNMEGVAAVRMADGATRLYIVSDDNFNRRQRTLLLAFDIIENTEQR